MSLLNKARPLVASALQLVHSITRLRARKVASLAETR